LSYNHISDLAPLQNLHFIQNLNLRDNQISHIGALSNLVHLKNLILWDNQVEDLTPLVLNPGLGVGDFVDLDGNWSLNLTIGSANLIHIETLISRGVEVYYVLEGHGEEPGWSYWPLDATLIPGAITEDGITFTWTSLPEHEASQGKYRITVYNTD